MLFLIERWNISTSRFCLATLSHKLICFTSGLIPGKRSYLDDFQNVFPLACGTNFYSQCVPSNTVHLNFGFSSTSMHWLSKKPCDITGAIHHTMITNQQEKQGEICQTSRGRLGTDFITKSWRTCIRYIFSFTVGGHIWLESRIKPNEIRAIRYTWSTIFTSQRTCYFLLKCFFVTILGGYLVMAQLAIDDKGQFVGNTCYSKSHAYYLLYKLWKELLEEGRITEVGCYNFPTSPSSFILAFSLFFSFLFFSFPFFFFSFLFFSVLLWGLHWNILTKYIIFFKFLYHSMVMLLNTKSFFHLYRTNSTTQTLTAISEQSKNSKSPLWILILLSDVKDLRWFL